MKKAMQSIFGLLFLMGFLWFAMLAVAGLGCSSSKENSDAVEDTAVIKDTTVADQGKLDTLVKDTLGGDQVTSDMPVEDGVKGDVEVVESCKFSTPEPIAELNTEAMENSPAISANGLTLYFISMRPGGLGNGDIWYATRPDIHTVFGDAVNLEEINSTENERAPAISNDELTIYFVSDRLGGVGDLDIWLATRTSTASAFGKPQNLSEVNSIGIENGPYISADGLTIYFTSDRPGSVGRWDIWVATRSEISAPFGEPVNVAELNTGNNDYSPKLTEDGLIIYFASNRPGGLGKSDIWYAARKNTASAFSEPQNLVELNSKVYDEGPCISADGTTIYFASTRENISVINYDLYVSHWTCP